ncbi:MAG: sialate O-acetylesterase [Acidobacteriota bacterium]|nr:sialate O-acetylesterase [Acidobacteriota bacterium]
MRSQAPLALLLCSLAARCAWADVRPAALFSDHMVVQSGMPVPVWGTANVGEHVTVTLNGAKAVATAGADGKWIVRLPKLKPGGPFAMTVAGKNTLTVNDVLIGEVWLGSGQSNMQFTVSKAHASYAGMLDEEKEIAAANYPQVRMFTVKPTKSLEPQADVQGEWQVCTPAVVGDWSAVGYLFARDLNQALNLPVGIILSAYGASTAEAWVPRPVLAADPQLKPVLDRFDAREAYFKAHPGSTDADAPPAPQMLNARPPRAGSAAPLRDPVQDQHQPTVLYNAMIAPVVPYAIRGALWYQGESIAGGASGLTLYPHIMEALVSDWRREWGEGNFPFYAVQLAALKNISNNPVVREQQAKILALPNTGLAITIDIGDPANVHPKNKEPLGRRLTSIALAQVYGRKLGYTGPMYAASKIEGGAIRVRFTHAAGLTAKDGPLKWFQIAGPDGRFVDADARIDGDSVVVSSAQIASPAAVRYAWDNYPEGANLYNAAGLPAAPFRTDTFDALAPVAESFTGK